MNLKKKKKASEEADETPIPSAKERRRKEIIEQNITEAKATDSKGYRTKQDWWEDIMSFDTCRTSDMEKVIVALGRCKEAGYAFNLQGMTERGNYFFFITRMADENETSRRPLEPRSDKVMKMHEDARKQERTEAEKLLPHGYKTARRLKEGR